MHPLPQCYQRHWEQAGGAIQERHQSMARRIDSHDEGGRGQPVRQSLFPYTKENMARPRGRPPIGAELLDGRWVLTEASLEKAAERLVHHRTACRERYRQTRDALKAQKPELFKKDGDGRRNRRAVRGTQLPLSDSLPQSIKEEGDSGQTQGH